MKVLNYLRKVFGRYTKLDVLTRSVDSSDEVREFLESPIVKTINVENGNELEFPMTNLIYENDDLASWHFEKLKTPALNKNVVNISVTAEQLDQMQALYGFDAKSHIKQAAKLEMASNLQHDIIEMMSKLGWKHHVNFYKASKYNLNMETKTDANTLAYSDGDKFVSLPYYDVYAEGEAIHKRLAVQIVAASNIIMSDSKFTTGKAVFMNSRLVSILATFDKESFSWKSIDRDPSLLPNQVYLAGHLCGMDVYVDPTLDDNDNRVIVAGYQKNHAGLYGFFASDFEYDGKTLELDYTITPEGEHPESAYFTFIANI